MLLKLHSGLLMALAGLVVGSAALTTALSRTDGPDDVERAHANANDLVHHEHPSVGLCPWRDPEGDRRQFFPTATEIREETLILSGKRQEVAARLGRAATGEENALKVYRILSHDRLLGSVVARRVRGDSGVIELLLAVGIDGRILGSRLQRMRETDAVAAGLRSAAWLGAFVGKDSASSWKLGADIPDVSQPARSSAAAILDAAHTLLVQLAIADSGRAIGAAHR